jgi:hypothetical protein
MRFPSRTSLHVFLFTAAFGIGAVPFVGWIKAVQQDVFVNRPQAVSSDVLMVTPAGPPTPSFEAFIHACGGQNNYGGVGYTTGYHSDRMITVSFSGISHPNRRLARREVAMRLREADSVIEESRANPDHPRSPERFVLKLKDSDGESFSIIKYSGGDHLEEIASRDLETALAFEAWRFKQN